MEAFLKTFQVGIPIVLNPQNLLIIVIGTVWGLIFGAVPGLTATMGVALALPLTYGLNPYSALALLSAIYVGAISGGFISAGLINIPGTPSSIATTFDAHPMVKKGQAPLAMGISLMSSFFGGLIAVFAMIIATYSLAQVALKFGPFEYFALGILAFAGCIGMFEGGIVKNTLSILLGLLIAAVGADPLTGVKRLTFGIEDLIAGIDILPLLIGLFGLSEVFVAIEQRSKFVVPPETKKMRMGFKLVLESTKVIFSQPINFIRSLIIGFIIGVFPGVGGATSSVVAYGLAKSYSKHPEKFGTGIPDGVIASETANNATIAGALVPLLSLGIPGDSVTAMMIGGFMIHGMIPGPMLFAEHADAVYTVFASQILANITMVILGLVLMRFIISALSVKSYFLYPVITIAMVVGAYGLYNRVFDIWVALFFGFVGYVLRKANFPLVPLITAFILGPIVEKGLRQALALSDGSLMPLFTRPISLTLIILAVFLFVLGLYINARVAKKQSA
ncbi:tripartite tricarboxylate transporter permease [Fervidobacterium islandicum]|uniref:Tripartite tricarboxylate transporter permease n=1 Tax=Fervidobacterium islandicum TaxID=2423 RepID=A0AAI8GCK1_FERIS|nr:tripartite tricarboxylate transporter permease [Fervidobacterium islandicum]AMW32018.1 tripartite tricarboxylate transporter permease [Fervidobacterium islandicum]